MKSKLFPASLFGDQDKIICIWQKSIHNGNKIRKKEINVWICREGIITESDYYLLHLKTIVSVSFVHCSLKKNWSFLSIKKPIEVEL